MRETNLNPVPAPWRIAAAGVLFGAVLVGTHWIGVHPASLKSTEPLTAISGQPMIPSTTTVSTGLIPRSGINPGGPMIPAGSTTHRTSLVGTRSSSTSPKQQATITAATFLSAIPPYPGSTARTPPPYVSAETGLPMGPSGATVQSVMGIPATPDLVDLYRAWRVPTSASTVANWVSQELTAAGYTQTSAGSTMQGDEVQGIGSAWTKSGSSDAQFTASIWVNGSNSALLRYDGVVTYVPARSSNEYLATGASEVTISTTGWPGEADVHDQVQIKAQATIEKLVSTFNALPVGYQGAVVCPAEPTSTWTMTLTFAYSNGISVVTEKPSCGSFAVFLGTQGQFPYLSDTNRALLNLSGELLGVPSVTTSQSGIAVRP